MTADATLEPCWFELQCCLKHSLSVVQRGKFEAYVEKLKDPIPSLEAE